MQIRRGVLLNWAVHPGGSEPQSSSAFAAANFHTLFCDVIKKKGFKQ